MAKISAVVMTGPVLSGPEPLNGLECQICCEKLDMNNYISYRLEPNGSWYLVTTICRNCFEDMYDSQNAKVQRFVEDLSSLDQCSKLLKHLLRGEYGIPVNVHDVVIFPGLDDRAIPNFLDPEFGRKSEVYELRVGCGESRDPHLSNAPSTREGVRELLRQVVDRVRVKLRDYDCSAIGLTAGPQPTLLTAGPQLTLLTAGPQLTLLTDDDGINEQLVSSIRKDLDALTQKLATA